MAKRRKDQDETEEQSTARKIFEQISNLATRSEKTSWNRKHDKMVKLTSTLKPIEVQILELMQQKYPILDDIHRLRQTMCKECVHPYDFLVEYPDHVLCKFCNSKLSKPDVKA